jgi:hypothetical protein
MTATTPVIENLKVVEQTTEIWVRMTLAGVHVSIKGTYNIDTNCFYPGTVMTQPDNDFVGLEEFCETMGWDYFDTMSEIQNAVENR